jgi:hypothetical protein
MEKWQEQWDRVGRYYERLERLNRGLPHDSPSDAFYMDDVNAFFQNCYHLKDWLKNDDAYLRRCGAVTNQEVERNRREIEDNVSYITELAICADICNATNYLYAHSTSSCESRAKHLALDRPPRSQKERSLGARDLYLVLGAAEQAGAAILRIAIRIDPDGEDAFTVATAAVRSWELYLGL